MRLLGCYLFAFFVSAHASSSFTPIEISSYDDSSSSHCRAEGRRKVLVIGLDGTKGTVFHQATSEMKKDYPNFASLVDQGCAARCENTTDVRCARAHDGNRFGSEFPSFESKYSWVTSPGWCSVTTGVNTDKHRVKGNGFSDQHFFANTSQDYPTMFTRAKRLGLMTAASGAPAFLSCPKSDGSNFQAGNWGIVDYECGADEENEGPSVPPSATSSCNLDWREGQDGDDEARDDKTTAFGVKHINKGCADLIMTHFDKIDHAGHTHGFSNNTDYLKQIQIVDGQVGQLLESIERAVAERDESWLVLVTADHGGHDKSHGDRWLEDEVVPFVVAVYGRNPPKPLRELKTPVRHFDVAPTAMAWLGVRLDAAVDGKVQGINY